MYRSRTRGAPLKTTGSISYTMNDCSNSSGSYSDLFATGQFEHMVDIVVEGFHGRKARGEVFFNPMRRTIQAASRSSGGEQLSWPLVCSGISKTHVETYYGNTLEYQCGAVGTNKLPGMTDVISASDILSLEQELSTRVLSQRGRSDANLYETIAEADRSLNMISGNFNKISRLVDKAKLKSRGVKTAADLYLTYRYGVLPLMRDTGSIIEGLEKDVRRVRQTTRASGSLHGDKFDTNVFDWIRATRTVGIKYTDNYDVRAMSLDEYFSDIAFNIGFSTKGLMTLPWELIPYSFVVDWFTNVGDYIGALVPTPGFSNLGSCIVSTRRQSVTLTAQSLVGKGTTSIGGFSGGYSYSVETKQRRTGLASPGFVIKSDFRLTNLTRAADAAALVLQKIKFK